MQHNNNYILNGQMLDFIKKSCESLYSKESDIHRQIQQLLNVIRDFQYHVDTIRGVIVSQSTYDSNVQIDDGFLDDTNSSTFVNHDSSQVLMESQKDQSALGRTSNLNDAIIKLSSPSSVVSPVSKITGEHTTDMSNIVDSLILNLSHVMSNTWSLIKSDVTYDAKDVNELIDALYLDNRIIMKKVNAWEENCELNQPSRPSPTTNINDMLKSVVETIETICQYFDVEQRHLNDKHQQYDDKRETIEIFVNKLHEKCQLSKPIFLKEIDLLTLENECLMKQNESVETITQQVKTFLHSN
ncbi:unnamed protein product [Didymodactylos carnosus]|uniref:Uncharacterized protein n=1 Tax=Didymodactylos carnosus TaxID=1234261 RepID=A0A813V602_9BILA|nr:unnamed protein product [Didymodactylos carnosus]CAF3625903.1 unnamed protein product [Didymodactylos carnosus]